MGIEAVALSYDWSSYSEFSSFGRWSKSTCNTNDISTLLKSSLNRTEIEYLNLIYTLPRHVLVFKVMTPKNIAAITANVEKNKTVHII